MADLTTVRAKIQLALDEANAALATPAPVPAPLPTGGWQRLANTKLLAVAPSPSPGGSNGAVAVINSWSGAAARTKAGSEQLILWGGGHSDYYGNEVYALNLYLPTPTITRLTDPSVVDMNGNDTFASDGRPVPRHTYNGLVYLPGSDRLFAFEGARMPNGFGGGYAWTFELGLSPPQWHSMATWGPGTSVTGAWCVNDPNDPDSVICNWGSNFELLRYTFSTNSWKQLTGYTTVVVSYTSGVVLDPKRKKMLFIGGVDPLNQTKLAIRVIDLSPGSDYKVVDITAQTNGTCDALAKVNWPGLAYSSVLDKIVGWPNSGDTVYLIDCDTYQATPVTFAGGPPATTSQGMFGRFAYFPSLDAFAVVPAPDQDAYLLRLGSAPAPAPVPAPTPTPTPAPTPTPTPTPTSGVPLPSALGKSTYTGLDLDGDGYGVGPGCIGPTPYASLADFFKARGYAPLRQWFLSPTGNDATGAVNDVTKPYATWNAIRLLVKPGDVIILRGGSYQQRFELPSGAAGAPVILTSYPGELGVIDGSPDASGVAKAGRLIVQDRSWFIVDSIKTLGAACASGGTTDGQAASTFHDAIFRYVETVGSGPQGLGGISAFNGLENILIEYCVLHDVGKDGQHCIYLGSRGLPSKNVTIRRNIMYGAPWNGLHLNGRFTNLVLEENVIYNAGIAAVSLQMGISNSFIRKNLIFNFHSSGIEISNYPGNCALFGQGGTGDICPYDQTGNVFEYNTIYALDHDWEDGTNVTPMAVQVVNSAVNNVGDLGRNTFRNNILMSYGGANHYPPVVYRQTDQTYFKTSTFDNNLYWSLDGGNAAFGFGAASSYGWQPYTLQQAASLTNVVGGINADPKFVDASPTYYSTPTKLDLRAQGVTGMGAYADAPSMTP